MLTIDFSVQARCNLSLSFMFSQNLAQNDGLRVLGSDKLLEVLYAVQDAICLLVAVQVESHIAVFALEAEFVVDFVASLLPLLGIHRLLADHTLLCHWWLPRHG